MGCNDKTMELRLLLLVIREHSVHWFRHVILLFSRLKRPITLFQIFKFSLTQSERKFMLFIKYL